jgi:hypothetical protein
LVLSAGLAIDGCHKPAASCCARFRRPNVILETGFCSLRNRFQTGIRENPTKTPTAASIGQAITRRAGAGKRLLLADLREEERAPPPPHSVMPGFEMSTAVVDVSSRESVHALAEQATALADFTGVVHCAGVSPTHASPATILKLSFYGTALVLEEGNQIVRGQTLPTTPMACRGQR